MNSIKTKQYNDELFKNNLDIIKSLCNQNWIPAEIGNKIGMERHAMLHRLRKYNLPINNRKIINNEKVCYKCKIKKTMDCFAKKSVNKTYSSICRACRKIYLNENKERSMLYQAKNNAKQRNHDFNLTIEDIVIPEFCPILNVKLDNRVYRYSPSIDRIDSKKGYIKGNIQIISTKANNMKNDASEEELLSFAKYYMNILNKK